MAVHLSMERGCRNAIPSLIGISRRPLHRTAQPETYGLLSTDDQQHCEYLHAKIFDLVIGTTKNTKYHVKIATGKSKICVVKSNTYFGYGTEIAVHGLSISNRAYSNAHYKLQDIANRIMDIAKNKDAYLVRGCFNGEQPCGRIFISSSLRSRYGTLFLSLEHQSLIVCTISPYLFLSLSFLLLLLMLLLPVEPGKCAFIHFFFLLQKIHFFPGARGAYVCIPFAEKYLEGFRKAHNNFLAVPHE